MNTTYITRYEGEVQDPNGGPAKEGGEPGGAGPPAHAAPDDVFEKVLEVTPDSVDDRLAGVALDDDGNPTGRPPREYSVADELDDETGARRVRGQLPASSEDDARALADDLEAELGGMDSYEVRVYETPLGAVSTAEVRAYYEALPEEELPTDEEGEPYVPSTWDPERHLLEERSG